MRAHLRSARLRRGANRPSEKLPRCICLRRSGPEKGGVLEEVVRQEAPQLALELGTFMGYGAIRIARALPPGGRLVTVEASAEQVGGLGKAEVGAGCRSLACMHTLCVGQ